MLSVNFDPFPVLTTNRLLLRRVESSDVNEILFLRSDERVLKFLNRLPAHSLSEASEFIQSLKKFEENNNAITWAVTLKDERQLIGTICFWNIQKEHYRAEIGYVLHPDFQGKGIMKEAVTEVLKFGLVTMKLHSVEAIVDPRNASSIKLLEKNGFKQEAHLKENCFYNGRFLDTLIYSLLTPGV